jgi:hypothetical protein
MDDDNEMAKLTSVRVVPLPDFLVYPHGIHDEKLHSTKLFKTLLKLLFLPRNYVIKNDKDRSSFLKVIRQKRNELIYDNPSLEACVKFKFSSARHFYLRHLIQYLFFALIISLQLGLIALSSSESDDSKDPNISQPSALDYLNKLYNPWYSTSFFMLILYFTYYLIAVEIMQIKQDRIKRYLNFYNFVDIISIILPFFAVFANYTITMKAYVDSINYVNGNSSAITFNDLNVYVSRSYDVEQMTKIVTIINSFIVLVLWLELVSKFHLFIYLFIYLTIIIIHIFLFL